MQANTLNKLLNKCFLQKLSHECYDNEFHVEYKLRNSALQENFKDLLIVLKASSFKLRSKTTITSLCYLLQLYLELKSEGPWNTDQIKEIKYEAKLNKMFKNKHRINVDDILRSDAFDCQAIFDKCIQELHKKLNMNDFKKYPALIEVYCLLISNVKSYKVKINVVTVMPISLLLIDDFITSNKIKGLQSCTTILQCLTVNDFAGGNYYEVIYNMIQKCVIDKGRKATQAQFTCYLEFLKVVPTYVKKPKLDEIYSCAVDQLHLEPNLYKKVDCLNFMTKIIEMHGIDCLKKTGFLDVVHDIVEMCTSEGIAITLLPSVLECFQMWLKYCWCVWTLSANYKLMASLFKILYLTNDEAMILKLQNLLITLIKLCSKNEQMDILDNLNFPLDCANKDFVNRLDKIKKQINCSS